MRTYKLSSLVAVFSALTVLSVSLVARADSAENGEPDYDRLDGHGTSGKTVNVVEWEGNLEIHVAPKGSLKGLGLKLDTRNKSKPVMVIAYRFDNDPKTTLTRRNILGIKLNEGFHAYRDPKEDDYDKIVITNHAMTDPLVSYPLDPSPTALYPEGSAEVKTAVTQAEKKRAPASVDTSDTTSVSVDDSGTIKPFFANPGFNR
jgi:hypothetical protein